jgi:hypothetical protein
VVYSTCLTVFNYCALAAVQEGLYRPDVMWCADHIRATIAHIASHGTEVPHSVSQHAEWQLLCYHAGAWATAAQT